MSFFSWLKPKASRPVAAKPAQRKLSYQCASLREIGNREQQEDACELVNATDVTKIRNEGLLAIVADGMGGLESGSLASSMAVQIISGDFAVMDRTQPLEPQLAGAIDHACELVHQEISGRGGSTAIACMLYDQKLYYAGVGDSYLYLLRQGRLTRINRQHNLQNQRYLELIQAGSLDPAPARTMKEKHAVTQFLGVDQLDDVDWLRRALPLQDGDVLLACTDGIGGVLTEEETAHCMSLNNANDACNALKQAVLQKNLRHQDNFTGVLIRCSK